MCMDHDEKVNPVIVLIAIVLIAGSSSVCASTIEAGDLPGVTRQIMQQEETGIQEEQEPEFSYALEGRPDPFVPFITPKATTPRLDPNEIIEEDVELTGMRQFEPGQLRLVATLFAGAKRMAMVEDVTGKGYIIYEGTPIGRRGRVTRIGNQQVEITETAHTRAGKEIVTKVVMRLKKEGEN